MRYLRGRSRDDIIERLREGAREAGVEDVSVYPDELAALQAMIANAATGDVVGVTALGKRPEIFAWLEANGGERLGPTDVRRIVKQARTSQAAATDASHP
jgi:cyanophycin synthetase